LRLRGIIFDFDGTIADTLPVCLEAFRVALRDDLGRDLSDDELLPLFGPSEEGIIQRIAPDNWQAVMAEYLAEYERLHAARDRSYTGIESVFDQLKQRGARLAIASGKGSLSASISLRLLGWEGLFDLVETGSAEGNIKTASIRKILSSWALLPGEVAYLGDSDSDVEAAEQAGVLPLGAAWGEAATVRSLQGSRRCTVFATVEELAGWVQEHFSRI
jgi:pyrophosphatase PpaX